MSLLSGTTDTAFLVSHGIVMSCTNLYLVCPNIERTPSDAECTSTCWVWVWTVRKTAYTMVCTPSLFCTRVAEFISIFTIRPYAVILIHILLFIDWFIPLILIYNSLPCMLVSSCRFLSSWFLCGRSLSARSRSLSCWCLSCSRCLCCWLFL